MNHTSLAIHQSSKDGSMNATARKRHERISPCEMPHATHTVSSSLQSFGEANEIPSGRLVSATKWQNSSLISFYCIELRTMPLQGKVLVLSVSQVSKRHIRESSVLVQVDEHLLSLQGVKNTVHVPVVLEEREYVGLSEMDVSYTGERLLPGGGRADCQVSHSRHFCCLGCTPRGTIVRGR